MNILLIIVVLILAIFSLKGLRKGLFGFFYGIISWIFIFCFASAMGGQIQTVLLTNTDIYTRIEESAEEFILGKLEDMSMEELFDAASTSTNQELLKSLGISIPENAMETLDQMNEALQAGEAAGLVTSEVQTALENSVNTALLEMKSEIAHALAVSMASSAVTGLSYLLAALIAELICLFVKGLIEQLHTISPARGLSRLLGLVAGFVSGVLICDLIFYAISTFNMLPVAQMAMTNIEESPFLTYLYANNYFALILSLFHF